MSSVAQPAMCLPSKRMSPASAHHAAERPQDRRLAGAVGAEQGADVALVDREADAVQRLLLAVKRVEPGDFEHHRPRAHRVAGAEIGADHLFVMLHLGRRALGDLAAEIERDDLVGDRHHQVHVVLDEQHGDLALVAHPADERAQFADLLVVEAAGRLVEQQQLRLRRRARAPARPACACRAAARRPGAAPRPRDRAVAAATTRSRSAPPPAGAPTAGATHR